MILRIIAIQFIPVVAVLTAAAQLQVKPEMNIPFSEKQYGNSRIVRGKPTTAEEFPWQLFISTDLKNCGGSIISRDWSMSAAHCFVTAKPYGGQGFLVTAKRITLYAGVTDKSVLSGPDIQTQSFDEDDFENHVFHHPEFNIGANNYNDITLIKNKEDWIFNDKVSHIMLADALDFSLRKELTVSGWGMSCEDCGTSNLLHYKNGLKLISQKQCTKILGDHDGWRITDKMICQKTPNSNTCAGDSGGPVITGWGSWGKGHGPPWVQIGIVSWAHNKSCDDSYPSVFTDVAEYINWIHYRMAAGIKHDK